VADFKDLLVWQKSIKFAKLIYMLTEAFPSKEVFGLTVQLRRAAISVSSNIAEGQARHSNADFKHFLHIARGSSAEIESQLILAVELGYITKAQQLEACESLHEIQKMLNGLISSLKTQSGKK